MNNALRDKKILITAGPTREYIDPVRFISNESSGKMGYAIAEALHNLGTNVYLVSGPVTITTSFPKDKITTILTAKEMHSECKALYSEIDIAVFCAAVADYTPKETSEIKIKKIEDETTLILTKTTDIAYEFGKVKKPNQKSVGFALETNNVMENARGKLEKKNFDLIVVNSPNVNEGFGYDTNKIAILNKDLSLTEFPLKSKQEVALDIVKAIEEMYKTDKSYL